MNALRALAAVLIAPVLLAVAAGVLPADEAADLLRSSDAGALAPPEFRARLAIEGPAAKRRHEIEVWRSGDSMLVRFLDAKERGKFVVQHQGGQWLIAPGAKKPVRLKASYRLYGGVTLEEIFSVPLEHTYTIESAVREGSGGDRVVVFELRARSPATLFPTVRYVVREAAKRPESALYRLRSGREAILIGFYDWTDRGPAYARRVILRDLLRNGAVSDVIVLELEEEKVSAALFDLEDATARRALAP